LSRRNVGTRRLQPERLVLSRLTGRGAGRTLYISVVGSIQQEDSYRYRCNLINVAAMVLRQSLGRNRFVAQIFGTSDITRGEQRR
jgi:hypothetical protein